MATELIFSNGQSLASYEDASDLVGNTYDGIGVISPPRISTEFGMFQRIVDGNTVGAKVPNLTVNIIDFYPKGRGASRTYYEGTYSTGGEKTAPECFSNEGVRPEPNSKKIQHETCDGCPQNIAGSGENDSRACRFSKTLAVLPLGSDVVHSLRISSRAIADVHKPEQNTYGFSALLRAANSATPPMPLQQLQLLLTFPEGSTGGVRFSAVTTESRERTKALADLMDTQEVKTIVTPYTAPASKPSPVASSVAALGADVKAISNTAAIQKAVTDMGTLLLAEPVQPKVVTKSPVPPIIEGVAPAQALANDLDDLFE